MRNLWLGLLCMVIVRSAQAGPWLQHGYQEAVFSVSSLATYQELLTEVAGWQEIAAGAVPREQLNAWNLAEAVTAEFAVFANPGTERGFIRLIDFDNTPQQRIRSGAQSWDTGGWFDVNSRVLDMQTKFEQLQRRGWQSTSDPVTFSFGPFVVTEWLSRGPDGIVVAMIERVQPPLEGWPALREMSRLFNATQIVSDMPAAREFYERTLGFKPYLEHRGASKEEGPNVLGIPHNLADDIVRDVVILNPTGTNEGSVELLSYEGISGADFSARATPPNLGILMLRFPTSDIDGLHQHLVANDVTIEFVPTVVSAPPYGDVRLMAVRGPDGVWIEFFEPVDGARDTESAP
ncbi:MAG: VOC family protein [Pseudomonadota bacterium]